MSSIPTANYKFERIEKKFWMNAEQYKALIPALNAHLIYDSYGVSTICNIYYDTPDYTLIRRSIERPRFKEKLRIRSYGIPGGEDLVFVEIKRKLNGIGYKRRIRVPFAQAQRLLNGEAIHCDQPQIEAELLAFVQRYRPQPRVYLTYQRYAMTDKDAPEFRVTIDHNLQYKLIGTEHAESDEMKPIMDREDLYLMEIKALGAIPAWLTDQMSRLHIYQAPFSKVGTCYTKHIAPNMTYSGAYK